MFWIPVSVYAAIKDPSVIFRGIGQPDWDLIFSQSKISPLLISLDEHNNYKVQIYHHLI